MTLTIGLLRKALACGAAAAALIGVCAIPAQAQASDEGFYSNKCEDGRACVRLRNSLLVWNINGCGFHRAEALVEVGIAHGNRFRVYYQDQRWDEVAAWSSRWLDATNPTYSFYVYC